MLDVTLSEWLLAQIAEDEAVARGALSDDPGRRASGRHEPRVDDGRWSVPGTHELDAERIEGIGITIFDEGGHTAEQAQHIARWDPARVLAECEAKRRIVERLAPLFDVFSIASDQACTAEVQQATDVLELLALPYADRPGYREEWKP